MNRLNKLVRRYARAREHGVFFCGTSYTRLPPRIRFGGDARPIRLPDGEPLLVADFINVVLDDEYGLRALVPAPQTVVDIGANVGFFANYARHRFPDATIHAYEPAPETAERAAFNIAHPLTTLFVEGVAASAGRAAMVQLGSSNLARTELATDGDIALVPFATVLERIGGQIDLLKVDCEGAEWDFMRDPALFAHVAAIRMEYHLVDHRSLDDVHCLAAGIGFKVTHLIPNDGFGIAWLDPLARSA